MTAAPVAQPAVVSHDVSASPFSSQRQCLKINWSNWRRAFPLIYSGSRGTHTQASVLSGGLCQILLTADWFMVTGKPSPEGVGRSWSRVFARRPVSHTRMRAISLNFVILKQERPFPELLALCLKYQ